MFLTKNTPLVLCSTVIMGLGIGIQNPASAQMTPRNHSENTPPPYQRSASYPPMSKESSHNEHTPPFHRGPASSPSIMFNETIGTSFPLPTFRNIDEAHEALHHWRVPRPEGHPSSLLPTQRNVSELERAYQGWAHLSRISK